MSKLSPDPVLLGLLEAQSCHGYQLLEHFRSPNQLAHIWNLSTSQLYAILKRLERAELLDGREEDSFDAPMRTVYWLTPRGSRHFYAWLDEPHPSASTRHIRTEFLSRLYLAQMLHKATVPIIEAQRQAVEEQRATLSQQRDAVSHGPGYLALDLRLREMDVITEWLAQCEQHLSQDYSSQE